MLRLSTERPVSSGNFRHCYRHPENPALCVKVVQHLPEDHHLGRVDRLLRRGVADPNLREYRQYLRYTRAGVPLERYFPKMHGFVETDLGPGLCMDYIEGSDGNPPVSLYGIATGTRLPGLHRETALHEWHEFIDFCVRFAIMACSDEPKNVGFVRDGEGYRLVAYDLKLRQNKELIPISTIFPFFRRRKIRRRAARTLHYLQAQLGRTSGDMPLSARPAPAE